MEFDPSPMQDKEPFLKRLVLGIAGLVLRLVGMTLKAEPGGPADEYKAKGPYRTPGQFIRRGLTHSVDKARSGFDWLRSSRLVRSRKLRYVLLASLIMAVLTGIGWTIYGYFAGSIPETSAYQLAEDIRIWDSEMHGYRSVGAYSIALPQALTRLWDLPVAGLWMASLLMIIASYRKRTRVEHEWLGILIGVAGAAIMGGTAVAIAHDVYSYPLDPSSHTSEEESPLTLLGFAAVFLLAIPVAAVIGSVLVTALNGIGVALRSMVIPCLVGALLGQILFNLPGTLIFGLGPMVLALLFSGLTQAIKAVPTE